jgi:hypothetical protein
MQKAKQIRAAEVQPGHTVTVGDEQFEVAGIRRNPEDERRVRLFSDDNVMRAELEPDALVDVVR